MTTQLKDAGTLIRLAYQSMQSMGLDADEVLRRSNLTSQQLYDSSLRTPHQGQSSFWQAAEAVSGDAYIGLSIGDNMPVFKGLVLEYLLISAANYRDGIERIINYQRLISDALDIQIGEDGDYFYLSFRYADSNSQLIDCTLISIARALLLNSDSTLQPQRVELCHSPAANPGAYHRLDRDVGNNILCRYQRAFNCQVTFEKSENRLYYSRQSLLRPSMHSQPELIMFHEQCAEAQLSYLQKQDLIGLVEYNIGKNLSTGEHQLSAIAKQMRLSPASLQQQLEEAGTSYSKLLNDYRHALSLRLLIHSDDSIANIVQRTGFSEPSTFYRAFKRWEAMTPIEYRKKHRLH
ncbi:AraC family transcriptional regulator [Sinobacterium caligoides]|uniref:AraC family transcriptional regulator n=1 Tax=Sinobacterium caligoides TaxID=933926 RepID=A0A3N2D534_9GAMM|nr:AraC family transcriptional regulator [Sinobacterium caligoides]ROR94916.1 AraC family transcriptional regulator [Sinobacterium caligoides]